MDKRKFQRDCGKGLAKLKCAFSVVEVTLILQFNQLKQNATNVRRKGTSQDAVDEKIRIFGVDL